MQRKKIFVRYSVLFVFFYKAAVNFKHGAVIHIFSLQFCFFSQKFRFLEVSVGFSLSFSQIQKGKNN